VDGVGITVDDCAFVSRMVSVLLDVEDPIPESYTLEVSSAGLDRPLVKLSDFEKFSGSPITFELKNLHKGRRRFRGILRGVEGNLVKVELIPQKEAEKIEVAEFAFSDIQKAKIIPDYETSR